MIDFNRITIIYILSFVPIGIFLGCGLVYIFNHIPVKWLCEYGEEPSPEAEGRQRLSGMPWKYVLAAFFTVSGIYMLTIGSHEFASILPVLVILWLLVITAIADAKYMIIPDQFVFFLILMAFARVPFGMNMKDMLLGALAGSGFMLLTALCGYLVTRRESLGFGDVKLMLAIGLASGLYPCIAIMAAASIISGVVFSVKLLKKQLRSNDLMPLGPYLAGCAAAFLVFF